jgi:hypothetical protein
MRMRLFISLLASAISSILVSGCLVSEAPLITAANGDRPLPAHFVLHDEGSQDIRATVDLADDNSYIVSYIVSDPPTGDEKSDRSEYRLRFKKIGDNLYASSRPESDSTGAIAQYVYGYMRVIDGNRIAFRELNCQDFAPADVTKLGVEVIETGDFRPYLCAVPSLEVLEVLIRNYLNDPRNADAIKASETTDARYMTSK